MITKQKLLIHCQGLIAQKIENVEGEMRAFQEAANEDTKSSAGDKYETNRSMMNLEKEKAGSQLVQLLNMKRLLDTIKTDHHHQIELGSLVTTNRGIFLIAIGLGKVALENEEVMVISAASPIGQALLGKGAGDAFDFRGVAYEIMGVE